MTEPAPAITFMYVGNLEPYQGIDLLLSSFALLLAQRPRDRLIIIGGIPEHIRRYRQQAAKTGMNGSVEFRGPQPVARMAEFLKEADILVSPRTKGANTPMKIYSYMDSGKPIVATDLFTHTQVLNARNAMLAPPQPAPFAAALQTLASTPALRQRLAEAAQKTVREQFSTDAFRKALDDIYNFVEDQLRRTGSP